MLSQKLNFLLILLLLTSCITINQKEKKPAIIKTHNIKFQKDIQSIYDFKTQNITMQKRDYSCGAAALATLLQYYFDDPITEEKILLDIFKHLPNDSLATKRSIGLSMLDLKEYATRHGYQAIGIKLTPSQLKNLKIPILAFVSSKGYKHFLVINQIIEDRILLSDPSLGNIRMPIYKFMDEFSGIALIILKEGFNYQEKFKLRDLEKYNFRNETLTARHFINH